MNLKQLTKEIPYKWRVQSYSKNSPVATCVAYIDARDVMSLLDDVVGAENWQSDYKEIKGNLYGGIGIKINTEWVWKWDCGSESSSEKEKGESSDAFKRAAVKWGIGRFLYSFPIQFVRASEVKTNSNYPYPIDDKGNKIKDLTAHLNKNKKIVDLPVKNIREILNQINNCTDLDDLRDLREKNKSLEEKNAEYKSALHKKYQELTSIAK